MFNSQYLARPFYGAYTNLTVKTNGGQVLIEKQVGSDWVVCDTISADGAVTLQLGNSSTRFTPSGGAVFEIS